MFFATEEKTIGLYTYKVTQFDAVTGIEVLARLMNIAGPAFEEGKGIGELLGKLKASDIQYFVDKFGRLTTVSGGDLKEGAEPRVSDIFAAHFAGRYKDLFAWLGFCFEVNYRSFFGEGIASLGDLVRKVTEASSSPKTSKPGSSGSGAS